jgi:hypothetical protein
VQGEKVRDTVGTVLPDLASRKGRSIGRRGRVAEGSSVRYGSRVDTVGAKFGDAVHGDGLHRDHRLRNTRPANLTVVLCCDRPKLGLLHAGLFLSQRSRVRTVTRATHLALLQVTPQI